ncbi:MAG: hypothetical protein J6T10_30205 [Methanobrevibacter sp.]|nr:hypothetical protein [Methanobrevibacter sp.]
MKIAVNNYPFAVYGETKKSKAGKEYTSVSIRFNTKDQTGQKIATYFNLFDERDLLVLSNLCEHAYRVISEQKTLERFEKADSEQKVEPEQPKGEPIDDEIPFEDAWNQ